MWRPGRRSSISLPLGRRRLGMRRSSAGRLGRVSSRPNDAVGASCSPAPAGRGCARRSRRGNGSPRRGPRRRRRRAGLALRRRWYSVHSLSSLSRGMPVPVSLIDTTASLPCRSAVTQIFPHGSVYLQELLRMLLKTWVRRVASALR